MYIISTTFPLAFSKKLCKTKEELTKHVTEVVAKTEEWRKTIDYTIYELTPYVSEVEIALYTRIYKIDPNLYRRDMLGSEMPITCQFKSPNIKDPIKAKSYHSTLK
jgi:hypothetical protein